MSSIHPDTHPFDLALKNMPVTTPAATIDALIDVADTVDIAKKMLLQARVRDFKGSDVVELTRIIIDREQELYRRERDEVAE